MASTSIAHRAHTVPEETRERVLRGLVLHADHVGEITHEGHGVYTVPGCGGGSYEVNLVPFGGEESCTCPDYRKHKAPCKHLFAATIYRAKSRRTARKAWGLQR
ncbi:MAG: SWIM zinc finger domain-containing protein [Actinobacteria bacterium]|nr:SWIM zinc finger domain-containing protein [Actinomycetota bacterium]MCA1739510.1 SWIM zinc finger domain-containing protein [Actinomycetota bacterium]